MPLVRFGVKNEFKLGVEELYKDGVKSEDPKAVLDGVAVAGLVGVLRQLGDLAQFGAEVFHGLQEQVASTSSRSRKLLNRVQRIEASLPSIEKAILSQTDHLRFAYTRGSEVHACVRIERNHFICDDLPHFVMDSYEECREPPRLQLLDRFDSGGPGSCLKRYSDPTFFKRASTCSEVSNSEKSQQERKTRKIKKRRSSKQSGQFPKSAPTLNVSGSPGSARMQFSSTGHGQSSLSQTGSNFDMTFKSDLGDQSDSRDSRNGMDFIELVSRPSISSKPLDETKDKGFPSSIKETDVNTNGYLDGETAMIRDDKSCSHDVQESLPRSSTATWDERLELLESTDVNHGAEDIRKLPTTNSSHHELEFKLVNEKSVNQNIYMSEHGSSPKSNTNGWLRKTTDENIIEPSGLNYGSNEVQDSHTTNCELEDRHTTNSGFQDSHMEKYELQDSHSTKYEIQDHYLGPSHHHFELQENYLELPHLQSSTQAVDLSERGKPPEPTANGNWINNPAYKRMGTDNSQYLLEANSDVVDKDFETTDSDDFSPVHAVGNIKLNEWDQQEPGTGNTEHAGQVHAFSENESNVKVIEWNERGLEAVNPEYISEEDTISEGGDNVNIIEWNQQQSKTVKSELDGEMDFTSEGGNSVKLIEWNQQELETPNDEKVTQVDTFIEGENTVQVIEWNEFDDIDSGTDNFVDALNTIESESESDFETEVKAEVLRISYKDELEESTVDDQIKEKSSHLEPESQDLSTSYECNKEGDLGGSERPTIAVSAASVSSTDHIRSSPLERPTTSVPYTDILPTDHTRPSHDQSESVADQKLDVATHLADEQTLETGQTTTLLDIHESVDIGANASLTRMEPAFSEIENSGGSEAPGDERITHAPLTRTELAFSEMEKSGGSEAHVNERITHAPDVSQEASVGSSTSYPVAFWTNGSLLGLAPSKPVVFSTPNPVDSSTTSNSSKVGQSSNDAVQKVDGPAGAPALLINESERSTSKSEKYGQDVGSFKNLSQQLLGKTDEKSVSHDKSNSSDHTLIRDLINGDPMLLESKVLVGASVKNVSTDATAVSEDKSSLLSVLSRGLLKNGLRRSGSLGYDERHESSSPSKSNDFDYKYQEVASHPILETNSIRKFDSPVNSPPSSPPLEHMKISFQPVDGFDASRLKLKYPEGIDQYESTLDAFPSFQLVPESTKLQNDIGSDSDDDTFCRSYACISDVSRSHQSDSDSEQWESGDSTESNDPTLYNGLQRISSTESASTSPLHDETDHENIYGGSRSVNNMHSLLPVLDTKHPFSYQEVKLSVNPGVDSSHLQKSTHEPPPLPPLQWRLASTLFGEVEDNQDKKSYSQTQSFVPKLSDSSVVQPPKVDSGKLISTAQEFATVEKTKESPTIAKPKKVEEQKTGQEQSYHTEKEQKIDGGGDFLHQIRTRSFNLKRAEPARPMFAPVTATNTKITAILQKANAIRQAVGSDDGEDDSWSDT